MTDYEKTIDELCISLIGIVISDKHEDNIERWKMWMRIYPGDTPRQMHEALLRRKKYHFRCVLDFALAIEFTENDSPIVSLLKLHQQQALCELRRVDAELMSWDFQNGILCLKKEFDSLQLFVLAGYIWSTNEWIYDTMWDLTGKKTKSRKNKGMGTKLDQLGDKPHPNMSTKDYLRAIHHGHKFIGPFAAKGIGELLNCPDMPSAFWREWVKRIGMITKLHNELFRVY